MHMWEAVHTPVGREVSLLVWSLQTPVTGLRSGLGDTLPKASLKDHGAFSALCLGMWQERY